MQWPNLNQSHSTCRRLRGDIRPNKCTVVGHNTCNIPSVRSGCRLCWGPVRVPCEGCKYGSADSDNRFVGKGDEEVVPVRSNDPPLFERVLRAV